MRCLLLLFVFLSGLSCSKEPPPTAPAGKTTAGVAIPDEALRRYIEKVLKKKRGATITHAEMKTIVNLLETRNFEGIDRYVPIKSLVGLEAATNLQNLVIGSDISDVSPLANLSKLRYLILRGNEISDVSPLADLPRLRHLDIRGNKISDVSPLADLPRLRHLDLRGNFPLNDVSLNEHVPALQRRGVEVMLSPYDRTFPDSPFDIELVLLDDFTEDEQEILHRAARRWEAAIQADIPDYTFPRQDRIGCGITNGVGNFFTIPAGERIDDLRIYVRKLSEPENLLQGFMYLELVRSSAFPIMSCVQLNVAQLPNRYESLWNVAIHEIGHSLGIGASWGYEEEFDKSTSVGDKGWKDFGLLRDVYSVDAHFAGPQAIAAFDQAGGTHYQGKKVPTEVGGSHWHYGVLLGDIMSQSYDYDSALSAITLGALSDMGYTVDFSEADPYELPPLGAAKPVADEGPFCKVEMHPPVYVDD